ncbi:MAG: hypothetical protein KDC53_12845, partial [Saprospiraceae bacterium]|nr:hypothetical protein [Saprospiraceae bacterium]
MAFLLLSILAPVVLFSRNYLVDGIKKYKDTFVEHDPVLYTVYLAIRRAQIRNLVEKREGELESELHIVDPRAGNRKNLILITVDALRADFINESSLRSKYLPFFDETLRDTNYSLYQNVYANCNYSACGIFSILEGRASGVIEDKGLALQQLLSLYGYE